MTTAEEQVWSDGTYDDGEVLQHRGWHIGGNWPPEHRRLEAARRHVATARDAQNERTRERPTRRPCAPSS